MCFENKTITMPLERGHFTVVGAEESSPTTYRERTKFFTSTQVGVLRQFANPSGDLTGVTYQGGGVYYTL